MATKKVKAKAKASPPPVDPHFYEIKNGTKVDPPARALTPEQGRALGIQIAQAISEGRSFEVRPVETGAIYILVSAAKGVEDEGHAYLIDANGSVREIGHTEAS